MTKNYLVTGGAGFIGSNFIIYMLEKHQNINIVNLDKLTYAGNLDNLIEVQTDPRYTFVQGDICDGELCVQILRKYSIDYIVNFAAESHVDRSISDPGIFVKTNVLGTNTLLTAAKEVWQIGEDDYRPNVKFLQVSTDEVYGSLGVEGFFTEQTPLRPHSPYSASKAAADMLCMAYFDTYQLPINITRCSNNYGPYQFPEKLIPLIIQNARDKKPLPVYGDGLNVRDWLYVDDHCRAIDRVLQSGTLGEVYNIGGHNERTNIAIVKTIIGELSKQDKDITELLIEYVKDRKGHDRRYGIDPRKIGADLGWKPQTPFETGIVKTIFWYLENERWLNNLKDKEQ